MPPLSPAEAQQEHSLAQLLNYQKALQALLGEVPEAGEALTGLLYAQVQRAFINHPLPIDLAAVHYEDCILLTLPSGATQVTLPQATPRRLTALFNDAPWGGQDFEAPNRVYRYITKTTYREVNPATPTKQRTVHRTTVSTPAFEQFIDGFIRRPDRCFQEQLDRFWGAPFASGSPLRRDQWLAQQFANALSAEAALRVADQTLEAHDKTLIDLTVSFPSSQARAHLPREKRPAAWSLCLKGHHSEADVPFAGVFIVSGKTLDTDIDAGTDIGTVVLFTPDQGMDSFTSLQALDQALRSRFVHPTEADGLLSAIAWHDQARARRYQQAEPRFGYRPIQGPLFENRIQSLLSLQKQDIAHGWRQLLRHETDAGQVYALFDRAAQIGSLLDTRNRLAERSRRYIQAQLPAWYRAASIEEQHRLSRLTDTERAASKALITQLQSVDIPALPVFARTQLIRQLAIDHPGKAIDPDHISVRITESFNPASLGGGVGADHVASTDDPRVRPGHTTTLSLTTLALRNIAPWDFSLYGLFTGKRTVLSASGTEPSGQLIEFDERYLKALIHTLDVGKAYDHLLETRLIVQGAAVRKAWIDAHRARMASAALAARLDGTSLFKDREHRGYQWLEAIITGDTPARRNTVNGHRIVASRLWVANSDRTRNGYALNDVLVIGVEQPLAVASVILYTPAAPNDQTFKAFNDQQALQRFLQQQWATSPDWQRYVMQRLTKPGQTALSDSTQRGAEAFSERLRTARGRVRNPFDTLYTFAINTPLHDALYEQSVFTLRRNADLESASNAEVQEQSRWNKITFGVDVALNVMAVVPVAATFRAASSVARTFLLLKQAGASKSAAKALWSITGANGRPRLIPAFGALPAPHPAPDLSGLEVQVNPGDLNPVQGNLFQSKVSPQQYALLNHKYYLSDVAQGQPYIYSPSAGGKSLRYPLVANETLEHWSAEAMPRLRGGMDPIEKGPLYTTYQDYELPVTDVAALPSINLAPSGSFGLGILTPTLPQDTTASVLHLFAIQSRLRRHARHFFKTFQAPTGPLVLPARDLSPELIFEHLFNQRNGLVMGETHTHTLSRRLLIEQMPALQRQGLKSLYLEPFNTDLHQHLLDTFNVSPTAPLPRALKERLQWMDTHHSAASPHTYSRLVAQAHAQGIQVMALDATACAQITPATLSAPGAARTLADQLDRVTVFNFFAYKKISFDQQAQGPHRWVALVGHGHCSTLQGIPGLADLTGAVSVRLATRLPTLPMRTAADPGCLLPSPFDTHSLSLRCDVLIHMGDTTSNLSVATRVHGPHMFLISNVPHGATVVHYMNVQHQRLNVPIQVAGTQLYVDHPEFGTISHRRFNTLAALADALTDELHMIEV